MPAAERTALANQFYFLIPSPIPNLQAMLWHDAKDKQHATQQSLLLHLQHCLCSCLHRPVALGTHQREPFANRFGDNSRQE